MGPLGGRARGKSLVRPQRRHPVIGALSSGCASGLPRSNVPSNRPCGCATAGAVGGRPCRANPAPPIPRRRPVGFPANRDPAGCRIRMGSPAAEAAVRRGPVANRNSLPFSRFRCRHRAGSTPAPVRNRMGEPLGSGPILRPLRSPAPDEAARAPCGSGPDSEQSGRQQSYRSLRLSSGEADDPGSGGTT